MENFSVKKVKIFSEEERKSTCEWTGNKSLTVQKLNEVESLGISSVIQAYRWESRIVVGDAQFDHNQL